MAARESLARVVAVRKSPGVPRVLVEGLRRVRVEEARLRLPILQSLRSLDVFLDLLVHTLLHFEAKGQLAI